MPFVSWSIIINPNEDRGIELRSPLEQLKMKATRAEVPEQPDLIPGVEEPVLRQIGPPQAVALVCGGSFLQVHVLALVPPGVLLVGEVDDRHQALAPSGHNAVGRLQRPVPEDVVEHLAV